VTYGYLTCEAPISYSVGVLRGVARKSRDYRYPAHNPKVVSSNLTRATSDLGAADYIETALVERAAVLLWRLGRVVRYEHVSAVIRQEVIEEALARRRRDTTGARRPLSTPRYRRPRRPPNYLGRRCRSSKPSRMQPTPRT
jgi:hypothetical protein